MFRAFTSIFVLLTVAGCGSTTPGGDAACKSIVQSLPEDAHHTATCSDACGNGLNPPTGGPHCSSTVACRVHTEEQPACAWLHNLEHGHIVLLYNCPEGCADDVEALKRIWSTRANPKRIILTPWSGLEKKFAAIVWGSAWSGDTLDEAAIDCVMNRQDDDAPEPGLGCAQ